jgi:8-oxo-dGTP pyrophosphatase MutT (NUDIX family)
MAKKSRSRRPGAGFVLVQKFGDEWKVLGLRLYGRYDLPKGGIDREDGGNRFVTAQRECEEECGILVSPENLKWGNESLQVGHVTIFLAETMQTPEIQANDKTGIYEHHSADWLDWDTMEEKVYGYLGPAVVWARNKVEY